MESSHTTSSTAVAAAKKHKWGVAGGAIAALVVLVAAGFGVYSMLHRAVSVPFQNFTMTQVTNSGKAALAAISPDGKYVLSVMDEKGLQSLWLRNVATGSDTRVIPPAPVFYQSLAFSPDGNYIYFRKAEDALATTFYLYRAPVLGGTPQIVARDIDTDIGFSPEARRMAYARGNDPEVGKYRLLTANLDGNDEKVLQIAPAPGDLPPSFVAWSPDGKQIAYGLTRLEDALSAIEIFDLDAGKAHRFATLKDKVTGELKWAADSSALFTVYRQAGPNFERAQIGFFFKDGGGPQAITRDTNSYTTLTLSADGKTMATVQVKTTQSLYLVPGAGSQAAVISPLLPQGEYVSGFGWDRNGSLLISEGGRMLRMGVDGNNSSQILGDSASQILDPSVCGTRYLVFSWRFHGGASGRNIWRANVDGSGPTKVTDMSAQAPVCSTDEKWLYYINVSADQVWRVPLDGSGKAEVVPRSVVPKTFLASTQIGLSPDGKFLAFVVGTALNPEVMTAEDKIVLVSLDSATAPRLLNADPRLAGGGFQFTPDGKALAYPIRENGVDNIWLQPLDGSPGHSITNFNSEQIGELHWSLDGKNLGILRTHSDSDVVLLQESKR